MTTLSSRSQDRFSTTRWSVVMRMAASGAGDAHGALAELAQRYWYPTYAYLRCCGHSPAIAEEIARSFLQHLLAEFHDADRAAPARGRFRRFLLDELSKFLAGDWRQSVPGHPALEVPAELELRHRRDNAGVSSPEVAYQRSFALEVLARALRRLHAEAEQTGHQAMFGALRAYLTDDPVAGEYQVIAAQLQMPPLALVVALKRLRQRLRELVGQELSDTVTTADDLLGEQAELLRILRGPEAA